MSSRYETLIALKERAIIRGETDIAEATQRLIDTYYNRVEPHEEKVQPQRWTSRLWAWLTEAY